MANFHDLSSPFWRFVTNQRENNINWKDIAESENLPGGKITVRALLKRRTVVGYIDPNGMIRGDRLEKFSNDGHRNNEIRKALDEMLLLKYSYKEVAEHLGMTDRQLQYWRTKNEYTDPRPNLQGPELDNLVEQLSDNINKGLITIMSEINTLGYRVTEKQLRESMHRVDPDGGKFSE